MESTLESGAYLAIMLTQMNTDSYRFTGMIERVRIKSSFKVSAIFYLQFKNLSNEAAKL